MRTWILICLFGCAVPARPPPIVPTEPGAICPSSTNAAGAVHYSCTSIDLLDSVGDPTSLRTLGEQLVAEGRAADYATKMQPIAIEGADEAVLIQYTRAFERADGEYEYDRTANVLATARADARARLLECEVPSVTTERALTAQANTCVHMIRRLLRQPPPNYTLGVECETAIRQLPSLAGYPKTGEGTSEARAEIRRFAGRCTVAIASCALAAKSFMEATLCR